MRSFNGTRQGPWFLAWGEVKPNFASYLGRPLAKWTLASSLWLGHSEVRGPVWRGKNVRLEPQSVARG